MSEFRRGFCRIVRRRDDIGPVLDDVLEEKRAGSLPLLRTADKRLEVLHDQKVGISAQRFRRVVERPGRCGASAAQLRAAGAHDVRAVEPARELGGELRTVRHAERQQINNIRPPTFAQQIFHAPQVNFTKKGLGIRQALFSCQRATKRCISWGKNDQKYTIWNCFVLTSYILLRIAP